MTGADTAVPARRVTWRTAAAVAFIAAAVVGMAGALRGQGRHLRQLLTSGPLLGSLALAVVVMLASAVLAMTAWRSILAALGSRLDLRVSIRIYFLALLGAYLPGPFWPAVTGVHLGRGAGVPAARMAGGYLLSILVYLLSAAPVAALLLPFAPNMNPYTVVVPLVIALVLYRRPLLMIDAAGRVARLLRRDLPSLGDGSETRLRYAMLMQVLAWVVSGVQLWLLAVALGAPPVRSLPVCVGAFALATAAGALVIIAPDGVGVRELLMTGALALVLPLPQAVTAALASRVCCVIADGFGAVVGWASTHRYWQVRQWDT